VGLLEAVFAGWVVVVRTDGLGDPPICHRELGVQIGCALERTGGLIVVEGVDVAQSLIKELLRLPVLRGNRMMLLANAAHESCRLCGGGHVVRLREDGCRQRDREKTA